MRQRTEKRLSSFLPCADSVSGVANVWIITIVNRLAAHDSVCPTGLCAVHFVWRGLSDRTGLIDDMIKLRDDRNKLSLIVSDTLSRLTHPPLRNSFARTGQATQAKPLNTAFLPSLLQTPSERKRRILLTKHV